MSTAPSVFRDPAASAARLRVDGRDPTGLVQGAGVVAGSAHHKLMLRVPEWPRIP